MHTIIKKCIRLAAFYIILIVASYCFIEFLTRVLFPGIYFLGIDSKFIEYKKFGAHYGFKPNIKGRLFGEEFETDELGFRIVPQCKTQGTRHKNILVLGDSVSFGLGVKAEQSFPYLLQKQLEGEGVINASVIGYWIKDCGNLLEYLLDKKDFEGVIVSICLDDFTSNSQSFIRKNFCDSATSRKLVPNPIARFLIYFSNSCFDYNSFLREHSKAYLVIKNLIFDSSSIFFNAELMNFRDRAIQGFIFNELSRLKDMAVKHNKWILFCLFPYEYQLREDMQRADDILLPQQIIKEAAREQNLFLIDFYPIFKKHLAQAMLKSDALYLYKDPMHFSSKGNSVIAETIYKELKSRNLAE